MHVTRFFAAPPYDAPGHEHMRMVRLQGREAGPTDSLWMGVSIVEPNGGTTLGASHLEKIYVVLDGEISISNGQEQMTLSRWDSCRIAPFESRQLRNMSSRPACVLLAMPLHEPPAAATVKPP
ncbi:cupin domain-containing protein [Methylovirgula sp. 4M-Z18]|uniref:cupin domain-containing protein n=1 Tax=Methylovirgula sp. 4M-Z18 TaxID=2293567 RepID=UPI000E2E830C|nr:cupin domain-containing protein [Methylovirgula sp. 4M-Z18]RFB79800.1 cupin domain-containing protein [Methylovirgula sp. 4M-Z18]